MKTTFDLPFTESELSFAEETAAKGNAAPLRLLCRKEVEAFEESIKLHPDYSDGLTLIEKRVVEGYLYQKLRHHITYPARPTEV